MNAVRVGPPSMTVAVAAVISGGGAGIRIELSSAYVGSRPWRSHEKPA